MLEEVVELPRTEEELGAEPRVNCTRMFLIQARILIFLKESNSLLMSIVKGLCFPHHVLMGLSIIIVDNQGIMAVCFVQSIEQGEGESMGLEFGRSDDRDAYK